MYFDQHPLENSPLPLPSNTITRRPLMRMTSSSLDDILQAREIGFGEVQRFRRPGEVELRGEGEERNRDMLALMPSDPPSMDLMESADEDECMEDEEDEDESEDASPVNMKPKISIGLGRPSRFIRTASVDQLGRATSLDVLASSSRAKQLVLPGPPRAASGSSSHLDGLSRSEKRALPSVPTHCSTKRARLGTEGPSSSQHENRSSQSESLSRSHSTVMPAPPTPQTRTPGLTRSYSFSSTASIASIAEEIIPRNTDDEAGKTVYTATGSTPLGPPRKTGPADSDEEVVDAAHKLLQMLGGA